MAVVITRLDVSAADLREAAARTQDAKAARRMLAVALVLDGWSREAAAEACAMERQTLRDWVHRYNESGLEGLADRPRRNGPPPRLSAEQQAKVAEWVEQGPDLERDGVVRWRCVDLQQRIMQEFAVALHERTVGKPARAGFLPALCQPIQPSPLLGGQPAGQPILDLSSRPIANFDAESLERSRRRDDDPALPAFLHHQLGQMGQPIRRCRKLSGIAPVTKRNCPGLPRSGTGA